MDSPNVADDLDYMHARYYNHWIGRFLSPDPVRGEPGVPQSWNLYAYVLNNPARYADPFGLITSCTYVATDGGEVATCTDSPLPLSEVEPPQRPNRDKLDAHLSRFLERSPGNVAEGLCLVLVPTDRPQGTNLATNATVIEALQRLGGPLLAGSALAVLSLPRDLVPDALKPVAGRFDVKRGGRYEAFGNYQFGVLSEHAGLPYDVAQFGAGLVQIGQAAVDKASGRDPRPTEGSLSIGPLEVPIAPPYGDDPVDAAYIALGYFCTE